MTFIDEKITNKLNKEISTIVRQKHIDKKYLSSNKTITYADFLSNKMLMILVIREGVPYSFFNLIRNYTPFSENDWAGILEISIKSLQRYKQSLKNFKPGQSEKIIEMAEVTHVGLDVFGDMEKFKLWLNTPTFALGNMKPIELLRGSYGKEMVLSELVRINYGILA